MNRRAACGLAGLVGLLAGSVSLANDAAVEEAPLERWLAAYNSGDIEALSSMYADDARLQQGYCPAVTGRAAIEEFWRDDLGEATTKTYLEIEDTLNVDGLLYLRGHYAVDIAATPSAEARRVGGTYSQVWRQDATGWTIHRETWSNLACADIVVEPPSNREPVTESGTNI